jgi:hypothetical protein
MGCRELPEKGDFRGYLRQDMFLGPFQVLFLGCLEQGTGIENRDPKDSLGRALLSPVFGLGELSKDRNRGHPASV